MSKERKGENPGIVKGITKEFYGVPYSANLTRAEQIYREEIKGNQLALRQVDQLQQLGSIQARSQRTAEDTLLEIQRNREATGDVIRTALNETVISTERMRSDLLNALENGAERLEGSLDNAAETISGMPQSRQQIEELLKEGKIDDSEMVILALRGVLDKVNRKKLLNSLPIWKRQIIQSGLITKPDIEREKELQPHEWQYLAKLRMDANTPTANLRSIETAARHRLLDKDAHYALANEIREVRFGTEGTNLGIRELNNQGEELITQGRARMTQGNEIIHQGEELITQGQARMTQGNEIIHQGQTHALQTAELIQQGRKRAQTDETAINQRDISLRQNNYLIELAAESIRCQQALHGTVSESAGHIVEIRDISTTIARNTEHLEDLQVEGIRIMQNIGTAQLDLQTEANERLEMLIDTQREMGLNIVNIIEATRVCILEIEKRAIEREYNRDRISADESYRKAMEMLKRGKVEKAKTYLDESEQRWPADFRVYLQRGFCQIFMDESEEAEKDFKEAYDMASEPDQANIRSVIMLNLARLYYAESKIYNQNGDVNTTESKLTEAIDAAKLAIKEDPDFLEAHFNLAISYATKGDYENSIKKLKEIILKDQRFIAKLNQFEVFPQIIASFKNTIAEKYEEGDINNGKKASMAIARDSAMTGDLEMAANCLATLLKNDPNYLKSSKFWKMEEFGAMAKEIAKMIAESIESDTSWTSEQCYIVTALALRYKVNQIQAYKVFKIGAKKDSDFQNKNLANTREKLILNAGEMYKDVLNLIGRVVPPEFTWLINKT